MDAPRDDLYRALTPAMELRETAGDGGEGGPVMLDIAFARFGVWNEIDSVFEGRFLERLQPGAFTKTIRERGDRVKVLFNHGHDVLGDIPIGRAADLEETGSGPLATVELFDSPDVDRILPAIRAGALGASYRFRVVKEDWDDEPDTSDHNPAGLPERTIKEVQLFELGPVTFPADEGTTVGVRSLTDRYRTPAAASGTGAADTAKEPPVGGRHSDAWKIAAAARARQLTLLGVNPS